MRNTRIITNKDKINIIEYYQEHTKRSTAQHFHRDPNTIEKILLEYNIKVRSHEEELLISKAASKQTCLAKYGVDNPQKAKEVKDKTKSTCLLKYGATSYLGTVEAQEKSKSYCLAKYGVKSFLSLPESQVLARRKMLEKYGVEYAMQNNKSKDKKYSTQKQNHHMNTSNPEEIFYTNLLKYFLKEDIVRQYKDARYPFFCDFYIKSLDLFIEINHYYTHQEHLFDKNNQKDLDRLELIKQKGWNHVVNTWTIRDVLKYQTALKNNLNYITYYPKDNLDINKVLKYNN